jgi:hypothetical protein
VQIDLTVLSIFIPPSLLNEGGYINDFGITHISEI